MVSKATKATEDIKIEVGGQPPTSTRGRQLHQQVLEIINACDANVGTWIQSDAGTVARASSRRQTLEKHGIDATIRTSVIWARRMTPEQEAEKAEQEARKAAAAQKAEAAKAKAEADSKAA